MSLRETIQRHPRAGLAVGVVLVVLMGTFIISSVSAPAGTGEASLFFTVDDGKTWFRASARNIPPFDHQGRTACQVFVWTNDGGKTQVASHLFRYTAAGRQRVLEQQKSGMSVGGDVVSAMSEAEVKRPGQPESAWLRASDPRARTIASAPRDASGRMYDPVYP